ncbi:MAG: hypothetical protein ACI9QC_000778 [Oceanicoccus sp.]|jgi:hypothetical protein
MKNHTFWHRNSIAIFTLAFSLMISVGLASAGIFSGISTVLTSPTDTPEDEGGTGYETSDDCGFLMGRSNSYKGVVVNATDEANDEQACLDAFAGASTGLFENSSTQSSYVTLEWTVGTQTESILVDLAPSTVKVGDRAQMDLSTGVWSGYGKILSSTAGKVSEGQEWVWFDWACKDTATCDAGMSGRESTYYVKTNISTNGVTTGTAWSDYMNNLTGNGFFKFNGMTMETPPTVIVPYVEIQANGTSDVPSEVNRDSAPQANGYDYWRVGIYFVDMLTGDTLDESDLNRMTMSINLDDSVFINQVRNLEDAVDVSMWYPSDCETTSQYCIQTKDDGTVTFNKFIRSYGPTSNMVYMDEEVATVEQELPTDRDGCIWIYLAQLDAYSQSVKSNCAADTDFISTEYTSVSPAVKWDYFYARSDERNYIDLNYITFNIEFESSDYSLSTDSSFVEVDDDYYRYTPSYTSISFSPRFYLEGLYAEFDGTSNWTEISSDLEQTGMYLLTTGDSYQPSQGVSNYLGESLTDEFTITYQLDANTDFAGDSVPEDVYLVMDVVDEDITNAANNVTYYKETVSLTGSQYSTKYPMGYSYTEDGGCFTSAAAGTFCADIDWTSETADYIENPTAEVWVCDKLVEQVLEQRTGDNTKSCYFVGYLPVVDNHADPGGVLFKGSTNEFLGLSLDDSDDIYEGGAEETIKIRNNFYELGTRYTLGVTAGAGGLDLDASSPVTGAGESLMGDSLYYYNGDVILEEATSFTSSTLYVLGGDVYINGDIGGDDSRLGIIALAEDGVGGNVYIHEDVTDIYVNIFADGSVYSQADTYRADGVPTWINDAYRVAALKNQLYLNGSVSARMILNEEDVYSALGYYTCGAAQLIGANAADVAKECALESLRQFRGCYALDSTGTPDTSIWELCDEGEELSVYGETYADGSSDSADYPSVIMDYTAPGNLPIFASDGIFN